MILMKRAIFFIAILSLASCSNTYYAYWDNLSTAFGSKAHAVLTLSNVQQSSQDLMYVTHGERPQAVMALMFLEAGQHKWVSADKAMLIMEEGRIVRTLGFANDLLYVSNTTNDPIRHINQMSDLSSWLRIVDWKQNEFGQTFHSSFSVIPNQLIDVFERQITTTLVVESVGLQSEANFTRFDNNWKNYFWFDENTGILLKSEQRLAPFGEPISMTYISRVARLLPKANTANKE